MRQSEETETVRSILETIINEQNAREEVRAIIGKARSTTVNTLAEFLALLDAETTVDDPSIRVQIEHYRDRVAAALLYVILERKPDFLQEVLARMPDADLDALVYRMASVKVPAGMPAPTLYSPGPETM